MNVRTQVPTTRLPENQIKSPELDAAGDEETAADASDIFSERNDAPGSEVEKDFQRMLTSCLSACPDIFIPDEEHLIRYLDIGKRRKLTDSERQVIKFIDMTQSGYGVSRAYNENQLKYSIEAGGKNILLPNSYAACLAVAEELIGAIQGGTWTCFVIFSIGLVLPPPSPPLSNCA